MSTTIHSRQRILGALLVILAGLTILALFDVLATVFFAVTVAYVLAPVRRWLRHRGLSRTLATIGVTTGVAVTLIAVIVPLVSVLVYRIDEAFLLLAELPDSLVYNVGDQSVEIVLDDLLGFAEEWIHGVAISISTALPVLLVKFALFVFVVFALLHNERDIGENVYAVVPPRHRDIVETLHHRARDTLFAIYVLQGLTALATVLLALPFFYLLGYESWVALASIAGVLQFVPIIGPSLLIIILVGIELLTGSIVTAAIILVGGGALIAAAPDVILRPRLAAWTTELSSVLYFVGFVGGLLSLGAIGVIVGPLLIALLVEVWDLVADGFSTPEASSRTADPSTG